MPNNKNKKTRKDVIKKWLEEHDFLNQDRYVIEWREIGEIYEVTFMGNAEDYPIACFVMRSSGWVPTNGFFYLLDELGCPFMYARSKVGPFLKAALAILVKEVMINDKLEQKKKILNHQ